jgi:ankyrin repeat protein
MLKSLPRTLDKTYERMLSNIDEESADDAKRILSLLCTAKRPLTVEELIDGIAVELGDHPRFNEDSRLMNEDDIYRICPGFIELDPQPADNRTTVRIAHYSVQEYLESDRILAGGMARFSVRRIEAHTELACICLIYLMSSGLSEACINGTKGFYKTFSFSNYVAHHWPEHYRQGSDLDPRLHRLVLDLFREDQPALAVWVNISEWHTYIVDDSLRYRIPSPLYLAAQHGLDPVVRVLLANESHSVPRGNGRHGSALRAAAAHGHVSTVRLLLDRGADIDDLGFDGAPLHLASECGHIEVVKTLLDGGANIEIQDDHGTRPLHSAVSGTRGNVDIVRLLLDRGANINAPARHESCPEPATPNPSAIRGNAVGVDIYLRRPKIPLEMACIAGNASIVECLFHRGADVDQAGGYRNLLECAALNGHAEVVQLLLDRELMSTRANVAFPWKPQQLSKSSRC